MDVRRLALQDIPSILREIPDPPQQLFVQGDLTKLLERPRLSVVGSRKPTPYGKHVTQQLIQELAGQGVVIISGLAYGVDSLAHKACLEVGGQTIAVLAGGLDVIYPSSHQQLAQRIVEGGGALMSEYANGTASYKQHFIARNRLVSGLGDGVLIIEAADKSGTLHTANFALDQSKTVMVVPGNITSPLSIGTNRLITVGAIPITSSQDVLQALGLQNITQPKARPLAATIEEAVILELLETGLSEASQLVSRSLLEPAVFNQTLTMLEITGKIRALGAGHWSLN